MKRLIPMLLAVMLLSTASFASAKDVYVTKNGKKYHAEDCRWIKNRETVKMTEEKAIEKGYKPCGVCMKEKEDKNK